MDILRHHITLQLKQSLSNLAGHMNANSSHCAQYIRGAVRTQCHQILLSNPVLQKAALVTDWTVEISSFSGVARESVTWAQPRSSSKWHDIDTGMRQKVVIEFLTAEEVSPIEIHSHLNSVYGEHTFDVSTVRRWVMHVKSGKTEIGDTPQSKRAFCGLPGQGITIKSQRYKETSNCDNVSGVSVLIEIWKTSFCFTTVPSFTPARTLVGKSRKRDGMFFPTCSQPRSGTSDYYLFGPVKGTLRGRRFADDNELQQSFHVVLRSRGREFYNICKERFNQRRQNCVENDGGFVERQPRKCKGYRNHSYKFHCYCN
jgi:hypothetical protein